MAENTNASIPVSIDIDVDIDRLLSEFSSGTSQLPDISPTIPEINMENVDIIVGENTGKIQTERANLGSKIDLEVERVSEREFAQEIEINRQRNVNIAEVLSELGITKQSFSIDTPEPSIPQVPDISTETNNREYDPVEISAPEENFEKSEIEILDKEPNFKEPEIEIDLNKEFSKAEIINPDPVEFEKNNIEVDYTVDNKPIELNIPDRTFDEVEIPEGNVPEKEFAGINIPDLPEHSPQDINPQLPESEPRAEINVDRVEDYKSMEDVSIEFTQGYQDKINLDELVGEINPIDIELKSAEFSEPPEIVSDYSNEFETPEINPETPEIKSVESSIESPVQEFRTPDINAEISDVQTAEIPDVDNQINYQDSIDISTEGEFSVDIPDVPLQDRTQGDISIPEQNFSENSINADYSPEFSSYHIPDVEPEFRAIDIDIDPGDVVSSTLELPTIPESQMQVIELPEITIQTGDIPDAAISPQQPQMEFSGYQMKPATSYNIEASFSEWERPAIFNQPSRDYASQISSQTAGADSMFGWNSIASQLRFDTLHATENLDRQRQITSSIFNKYSHSSSQRVNSTVDQVMRQDQFNQTLPGDL